MSAVFTFGSFGDIALLVSFAATVTKLVLGSTGASLEYQAFANELKSFADLLDHAQDIVSARVPHDARLTMLPIVNGLLEAMSTGHALLVEIYRKIERFRGTLEVGGSRGMMRESWRKIGWSLFKVSELSDFRARLAQCETRLSTWLMYLQCSAVNALTHAAEEHGCGLSKLGDMIRQRPKLMGYPWEGGVADDEKPVHLEDFLGVSISIPIEFCRTWERADRFIKFYFEIQQRAGRLLVQSGLYDLLSRAGQTVVGEKRWNTVPGEKLYMQVLLPTPSLSATGRIESCSQCGRRYDGSGRWTMGAVVCYCGVWSTERQATPEDSEKMYSALQKMVGDYEYGAEIRDALRYFRRIQWTARPQHQPPLREFRPPPPHYLYCGTGENELPFEQWVQRYISQQQREQWVVLACNHALFCLIGNPTGSLAAK